MFWAAIWLAIVLVAIKAYYLGIPASLALADSGNYLRSLAAISYVDVLFAAVIWAGTRDRPRAGLQTAGADPDRPRRLSR